MLDIFNANQNEPKDCLVMNDSGGVVSPLMGITEASAFAAKAVSGRLPQLAGIFQAYVVRITPIKRFRDKEVSNAVEETISNAPDKINEEAKKWASKILGLSEADPDVH